MICLALLWSLLVHGQGRFLNIGQDSIAIYVEVVGEGKPIIFIPGWTMTSQFFAGQKKYFSEGYKYVTYDPRSHGMSSKTTNHNTYKDHAFELKGIIEKLRLHDVVLVGWSSGCATIYEYIQLFDIQNLSHLVFIDEPPKWIGDRSTEWAYGTFEGYRQSLKSLITDRESYASDIANWMTQQKLDSVQEKWMVNQMLQTPIDAALSLYVDGLVSDYSDVLFALKGKIPKLFMVRDNWYDEVAVWLNDRVPDAKVTSISSHAMFWENPDEFNDMLESFINANP